MMSLLKCFEITIFCLLCLFSVKKLMCILPFYYRVEKGFCKLLIWAKIWIQKNFSKIFTNISRLPQVNKQTRCRPEKAHIWTLSTQCFVFYGPSSKELIMIFYNSLTFLLISRIDNAILWCHCQSVLASSYFVC